MLNKAKQNRLDPYDLKYIFVYLCVIKLWHITIITLSQTNVILQYKLLTAILSAVCSVIQQS